MKQLDNCPTDSTSCIRFAPSSNTLIASSWDSNIYIYTMDSNDCIQTYKSRGPVLCCDFTSDISACSGGLDTDIKIYDLVKMQDTVIGHHEKAVSCMRWSESHSSHEAKGHSIECIVSGSWDGTVALWDPSSRSCSGKESIGTEEMKAYALDILGENTLLVATNTLQVALFDLRKMDQRMDLRESNLKYNLRTICSLPHDNGFACGCIEGRVSVDFLSSSLKPYCFKCHRKTVSGDSRIFPVNALAVHPSKSCLVTGGGDGAVYFWDYKSKKRLSYVRDLPTSVSSLAFNHDGSLIAIASSYLYENGKEESSNNPIFIRPIEPSDLPPFSVCEQTIDTLFTKNGCFFSRHLSTHAWMPWMKSALVSS